MITINGIENQLLEIEIKGYQFPEHTKFTEDDNWLKVYFNVNSKMGRWQQIDSCLETTDVQQIINWLNELALNKEVEDEIGLMEPEFSIKKIDSAKEFIRLRFGFDYALRPKQKFGELEYYDDIEYYIDCDFNKDGIRNLALDFERELSKFPER